MSKEILLWENQTLFDKVFHLWLWLRAGNAGSCPAYTPVLQLPPGRGEGTAKTPGVQTPPASSEGLFTEGLNDIETVGLLLLSACSAALPGPVGGVPSHPTRLLLQSLLWGVGQPPQPWPCGFAPRWCMIGAHQKQCRPTSTPASHRGSLSAGQQPPILSKLL